MNRLSLLARGNVLPLAYFFYPSIAHKSGMCNLGHIYSSIKWFLLPLRIVVLSTILGIKDK